MEKIESFVARTRGPMIPFVAEWYPWAYAHHYLRVEMERVPTELDRPARSLSLDNAMGLVHHWCAVTGEKAEEAARRLADAYLERWGLTPPDWGGLWSGPAEEQAWSGPAEEEQRWSEATEPQPWPDTTEEEPWAETAEAERAWAQTTEAERPWLQATDDERRESRVEPGQEQPAEPRLAPRPDLRLEARFEPRSEPRLVSLPATRSEPRPESRLERRSEPLVSSALALLPASGVAVLREALAGEPTLILPVVSGDIQDADQLVRPARAQLTTGR
jgi:hypothetical protein